jgi:hypothetical protein
MLNDSIAIMDGVEIEVMVTAFIMEFNVSPIVAKT